jgi:hypothetical protein
MCPGRCSPLADTSGHSESRAPTPLAHSIIFGGRQSLRRKRPGACRSSPCGALATLAESEPCLAQAPAEAAIYAARTRLRLILMTSFAFILGAVPLVTASGAGAELRQALGTAVFFGMAGVTAFGLLFTPTFYVLSRRLTWRLRAPLRRPSLTPAE